MLFRSNAWKIPEQVARNIDVDELSDDTPDGVTFHETMDGNVFVQTDRFQSVISPDKLESWIQGDDRRDGPSVPKSRKKHYEVIDVRERGANE